MSQNKNNNNNNNKNVESVTRSTLPHDKFTSAYYESIKSCFILQSEDMDAHVSISEGSNPATMTSQTVSFLDNAEGEIVVAGSSYSGVAKVDNTDDISLGQFLNRPTDIYSFTWSGADNIGIKATIKPWHLFLNNTNIKKKLDNYAFFRGKLHLKVLVNGTPFQYGLMRVCYSPLLGFVSDKIRTNPTSDGPLLVPYSQQPGFFITPAANAGGQMELPFFLHKNWLDITSATEVQNMGTINFVTYAKLGVAVTGGSSTVTVQVFAWATEVELMGTTAKLALQGDEYGGGSVSAPASALAATAAKLSTVPYIGKYARATEIGASAVSSIGKLFGYTNVPVIEDVKPFQPMNGPMLASSHIGVPIQKLTLDPKQELSIDPSMHGLTGKDELTMTNIKTKESYFGNTTWSTSDPVDTLLFNMRVNPNLLSSVDINNASAVPVGTREYNTPTSYLSRMFQHWRGSMVIRFKVVGTKFHKGRLKISYDPRTDISTTVPDVNSVYTQIIDIGEEDDFEITIPYHQDYPWLYRSSRNDNWAPGTPLAPRNRVDNGVLTVRVLNTLTAPASGSLYVLAFCRGGEDLEFANPAEAIGYEGGYLTPNFFALQGEDVTSITPSSYVFGKHTPPDDHRYGLNFGESILSLRDVLHRFMTLDTCWFPVSDASKVSTLQKYLKIMPYTPGYVPDSVGITANKVVAASGTAPYAYNPMTHIPYITAMFLGYRGGTNYVLTPGFDAYGSQISDIRVVRNTTTSPPSTYRYGVILSSIALTSTLSQKAQYVNQLTHANEGLSGMAITATETNGSISFQLPDFKLANFSLVDPVVFAAGQGADGTDRQGASAVISLKTSASATGTDITLQTQVGAAPDFTCLFFLCCPTVDYVASNVTPA